MAIEVIVSNVAEPLLDWSDSTHKDLFANGVYAFSNEDPLFKLYKNHLKETVRETGKAKAAIIGGGDIAHFMMSEMVENKVYDDLYLIDLNKDQIAIELMKLKSLEDSDNKQIEKLFLGELSAEDYWGALDEIDANGYDSIRDKVSPTIISDFKRRAYNTQDTWDEAGYSKHEYQLVENLKTFMKEVDEGKRKLFVVMDYVDNFILENSGEIDTLYLSNVHNWLTRFNPDGTPSEEQTSSLSDYSVNAIVDNKINAFGHSFPEIFNPHPSFNNKWVTSFGAFYNSVPQA